MTRALYDRTVLPPDETEPLTRMLAALRDDHGKAMLVGPDDVRFELAEAYRVLREVLEAMANGLAITIMPQHTMLTTQEAADLLGISRPTLVKLLHGGEIAYEQRGRHRRLLPTDVLDYQRRARNERKAHLDALVAEAGDHASTKPAPLRGRPDRTTDPVAFPALLDACVLFPQYLSDTLLRRTRAPSGRCGPEGSSTSWVEFRPRDADDRAADRAPA